jgi:hypothetical protein
MKCIIQIDESGNPINHPVLLDNFIQSFPDLDISGDTAPQGWAWFTKINLNKNDLTANIKQIIDRTYVYNTETNAFEDNYFVRMQTDEELVETYAAFEPYKPFPSWILDEDTLLYLPPVPKPDTPASNGMFYKWDESILNWIEKPIPTANTSNTA